ncbi:hypothetical protein [Halioxenophilus aromaticivorans]|uniref:Uncharacterized protein n=1 Tax=Halioxenophilus aromaticivorans TaxID=1306992 RepID=A0AAV3U599_9ALTE
MPDNKRAQLWVILAFLLLVCTSVGVTSFTVIKLREGGGGGGYRHVTMTDAYLQCVEKTKKKFGSRLAGYGEDSLSTRYNQAKGRYQIYIDAEVKNKKTGAMEAAFISCQVDDRGKVKSFGAGMGGDGPKPEPVDGGNPFGYDL